MSMTAQQLNERLAKALGWVVHGRSSAGVWTGTTDKSCSILHFSPATSSDHLRDYVLPELEMQELEGEFVTELESGIKGLEWWCFPALTASPSVLAAAALKVLEGGE